MFISVSIFTDEKIVLSVVTLLIQCHKTHRWHSQDLNLYLSFKAYMFNGVFTHSFSKHLLIDVSLF